MPYITREDGERFIIPSYREILSAHKKSKGLLKREIVMLSSNYGEYITLQKKPNDRYEVAFSPEPGYLLGESIWNHLKRPSDMIYCEELSNNTEAILVIVQSGSVFLDGSFPIDSIVEELIVYKTQQSKFSIFISGNVPISEKQVDGKISFDAAQVESFTVLDAPIFPTLPGVKLFQLQLVDIVLKANNIGTLPLKQMAAIGIMIAVGWAAISYFMSQNAALPNFIPQENPYKDYNTLIQSPDPGDELMGIVQGLKELKVLPGWIPKSIKYTPGAPGVLRANMVSMGTSVEDLQNWGKANRHKVSIEQQGIFAEINIFTKTREHTKVISSYQDVMANVIDRLNYVIPGNRMGIDVIDSKPTFTDADFSIDFDGVALETFELLANILHSLPLSITSMELNDTNGFLSGKIKLKAMGN